MAGMIDTIYTYRFLRLLSTKWENTDAYKLGIIDKNGNPLKKKKDLLLNTEKNAYTPFVRLVFKLKRLMGMIPGGKSAVARYGAALALIKENSEEVEKMGVKFNILEKGLKKYIDDIDEGFRNNIPKSRRTGGLKTFIYQSDKSSDLEKIIKYAVGRNMDVDANEDDSVSISARASEHRWLTDQLSKINFNAMVSEEVSNSTSGIEGKDQPLGKKGEVNKRKKKKGDDVVNKDNKKEDTNETNYKYQVLDGVLIRVDEKKRIVKKRIVRGKRQKKREFKVTKRINKRGNRKLRGAKKAKWKRSHKKAYRKAHTSSASARRKRSMKKSRKYNKK